MLPYDFKQDELAFHQLKVTAQDVTDISLKDKLKPHHQRAIETDIVTSVV